MTPTPEEVKDRVAVKHGYHGWKQFLKYCTGNLNEDYIIDLENKAMRDYAEALYKENLEGARGELPTLEDWTKYVKDFIDSAYDNPHNEDFHRRKPNSFETYEWMKEQASLVIAKERKKYDELLVNADKNLTAAGRRALAEKDKEIEKIKKEYDEKLNLAFQKITDYSFQVSKQNKEIEELKSEPIKFLKWIAEQDLENQLTLLDNEWFYESDMDGDQPLKEETLYKNYINHQH